MKRIFQSIAAVCLAGIVMVGCQSDNVAPQEGKSGKVNISGAAGDPHPALDTICQTSDTLFLYREDNGSPTVDKCFGIGGVLVPCNTINPMRWGGLVINEGYINNENVIDCNFWMAAGWYCNFNDWEFGPVNSFGFDQNGVPLITTDWSSLIVNPVQNKWQLRMSVGNMPTPSFDLALRVGAVRLNLFGAVTPGSQTTLWGRNSNWSKGGKEGSNSQWVMRFAPARCLDAAPTPVETSCVAKYKGVGLGNCETITASTTGLTGPFTYQWSTGATTASVSVCPTVTTTYSCTISGPGGAPLSINEVTVNVVDAACGNGNNAGQKVIVCHLPPGNPANMQEICISFSGVPAHVARFRLPGSNPHQGHDSGCEIGRCGSNPCL
ncbi:MAG TPA: SprB repeat-containing protein [Bacteroidia bacterium]|nr:SprB repeat-containing protein [Bacteroidia bacterium]